MVNPLPLYFQLKTHAQSDSGQKLSIDFFLHAKDVVGKFGWTDWRPFPCTRGMNEKAGMDAVELDKYFVNSIYYLYFPMWRMLPKNVRFCFVFYLCFGYNPLTHLCMLS